jgi:carboxypeptidase PM20D1
VARLIAGLLAFLLAAVLLLGGRGLALRSRQPAAGPAAPVALPDESVLLERLSAAIRIPTLSHQDRSLTDREAFLAFHRLLEASFPALHRSLRRETVNELSLLYTWPGRDPSLPGIVLMAHQDVVPVEPGTEASWTQPPFSGAVADGYVWGRGTLDTKGKLVALCEAVEILAAEGWQPPRTLHLVFGHDEEVGGRQGARAIAERFAAAGTRFDWVLDEGGSIGEGLVPGVDAPVALIGIAEKGFLTLALTARTEGGHSSIPPRHTAIGILAEAIARLETRPLPGALRGATREFLAWIGPEMRLGPRLVAANHDLLGPLLVPFLSRSPRGSATVRTTTAVTVVEGGVKENVLPSTARALANFRILPGDGIAGVTEFVRRTVDDPRVEVEIYPGGRGFSNEPSEESRVDTPPFARLAAAIRSSHPDVVVAPNLVLGGTDARWFRPLSENVYRFGPLRLGPDDLKRAHGTDERIGVQDYLESIRFYVRLLRGAA